MKKLFTTFFLLFLTDIMLFAGNSDPDSIQYEFREMQIERSDFFSQVMWKVVGDQQGFIYIIEKAKEDMIWVEKARTGSEQGDTIIVEYNRSITDHVESPVEHYRIRRLDQEGHEEIMKMLTIRHRILSKMEINSPPENVNKIAIVEFTSLLELPLRLTVEKSSGEIVFEKDLDALKGENWYYLKLKKLKAGRYIVVIRDPHDNKVQKGLTVYKK